MWLNVALAVLLLAATWGWLVERARRKQRNTLSSWPVPTVKLHEFDPIFAQGERGPSLETQVTYVGGADVMHVPGATSDAEAWILAVLAKRARMMFEFGTATGRTAYLWAVNSPPDARVVTLTLSPAELAEYQRATGDARIDTKHAIEESRFTTFVYTGTPVESKVTQLFGDSKAFDETPYLGQCDLIFVDGSHALSYVQSDSAKALRMLRPGGIILWHDYRGPRMPGVYEGLNALRRELPLVHLWRTSLVAYRKPA